MQFVIQLLLRMISSGKMGKIILEKLALKSPMFAKVLSTGKSIAKIKKDVENVLKYIDPQYLFNTLLSLPKKQVLEFLKDTSKNKMFEFKDAKELEKALKGDVKDMKTDFKKSWQDFLAGGEGTGWHKLSSSWIQQGMFISDKKGNGTMTIFIRSDKDPNKKLYGPYTYPMMPVEVWHAMRDAKGKNGTGAGTVMWRMWLRKWLNSYLRDYTYKRLTDKNLFNQKQYKRLPNSNQISELIREQQKLIASVPTSYYRTKTADRAYRGFPSSPIGNQTFGQAKPFSPIDSKSYLNTRKDFIQNEFNKQRSVLNFTQAQLTDASIKTVQAKKQLTIAKNNLSNFRQATITANRLKNMGSGSLENDITKQIKKTINQIGKKKKGL